MKLTAEMIAAFNKRCDIDDPTYFPSAIQGHDRYAGGYQSGWTDARASIMERLRSEETASAVFDRLKGGVLSGKEVTLEHAAISAATCSALIAMLGGEG